MKYLSLVSMSAFLLFAGCAKDKNMDDYKRDQIQQSISRITAVSGSYSGFVQSKVDGTNLGAITIKFQARKTDQAAIVSGAINLKSVSSAEVSFDNGTYDDVSGDFQVVIPVAQGDGTTTKISLSGNVMGNNWVGTIEVNGQPEYGGNLNLIKNATQPNTSSIEISGTRLQQINKLNYAFVGSYKVGDVSTPFKLNFVNKLISPEQVLYKLFSPIRTVNINCDFHDFELNFSNAILDDKSGTLVGHDPVDQRGNPARANLVCLQFNEANGSFGWDCQIITKSTTIAMHLPAQR